MMKYCIVVAIVYMIAGIETKTFASSGLIEELLIEHARNEASDNNTLEINNHRARHPRIMDDVLNTRQKRLTNTIDDNDGIRPVSFDPVVPEESIPKAPPVDHGSTQVGLNCVNKDGGCLKDSDGRKPVSFDVVKPEQPLPVPPPVEHGSSQAGIDDKGTEEHGGSQGKVPTPGVSTTEVSSTTKQVTKDQKAEPGKGHVGRPGCTPVLVLLNILLLFYYTTNII